MLGLHAVHRLSRISVLRLAMEAAIMAACSFSIEG